MGDFITLAHGSGGKLTSKLIKDIFFYHFNNEFLTGDDSAVLRLPTGRVAYTTDSFVISPIFFKGGDIGKLSVCGTVNDLTAAGAKPLYLSCGFIIEEGFLVEDLERIAVSMAQTAVQCGVKIVTGDTKVVQKGAADGAFINTSGIGSIIDGIDISASNARPGDAIIITGTLGDHGCSILLEREKLDISADIQSDCAPLNGLIEQVLSVSTDVHVLRDPTRGGLATALNEIASGSNAGIVLNETAIPIRNEVRGVCELLGMDPLYMANEGKMIVIVPSESSGRVLDALHSHRLGADACVIGEVSSEHPGKVALRTITGSRRIVDVLTGDQLPRIC